MWTYRRKDGEAIGLLTFNLMKAVVKSSKDMEDTHIALLNSSAIGEFSRANIFCLQVSAYDANPMIAPRPDATALTNYSFE